MRTVEFTVPEGCLLEFAFKLSEMGLNNSITGVNDDNEFVIEVYYEKNEGDEVDELDELLQSLIEEMEEEDEN